MDRLNPNEIGLLRDNIDVTKLKSLDEVSAGKLFRDRPDYFVWYHQYAMTRVYPKALRLDSANFSPVPFWNFGSQMVALNYQTPGMHILYENCIISIGITRQVITRVRF